MSTDESKIGFALLSIGTMAMSVTLKCLRGSTPISASKNIKTTHHVILNSTIKY